MLKRQARAPSYSDLRPLNPRSTGLRKTTGGVPSSRASMPTSRGPCAAACTCRCSAPAASNTPTPSRRPSRRGSAILRRRPRARAMRRAASDN